MMCPDMKPFRLAVLAPLLLLGGCTVSHIQDSDNAGGGLFSTDSSAGAPADARDTGARSGNDKPAAVAPRPYRYYPAVFVYFDADRGLYFFPLNKKWTTAPEIPESFKLETRKFVTIQVASEKPYLLNKAHRKLYPPPKPVKKVVKKPVPAVAPVSSTEPAAATPAEATPSAAA